jgi:general secretion pathway protein F
MIYHYQALDKKGESVSDFIDAPSENTARQKIRQKGFYPVKLEKKDMSSESKGEKSGRLKVLSRKVIDFLSTRFISKQVGLFSRQLATLLNAGMQLPMAISNIIEQIDNKHFRNIIADVKEKLEEGSSFSNALKRHRAVFSDMYVSMVLVGENLGSLDHVMERLAESEEKSQMMKNKIQAALYYPLFMLVFAIIVVIFLMINVIPSISEMFIEQNKKLPLSTEIVIAVSDFLSYTWYMIPFLVLGIIYLIKRTSRSKEGKQKLDEFKLKIPLIKGLYRKNLVYRFTQNLGILMNNKVDIIKSFEIVGKIVDNSVIEEKIIEAGKQIKEGSSISNALKQSEFLPKMVIGMIAAGEASDQLDAMMMNIGKVYETELELTITSLTNLLEPLIIIIMGLLIGTIVMAVMLPMMEMNLLVQ